MNNCFQTFSFEENFFENTKVKNNNSKISFILTEIQI